MNSLLKKLLSSNRILVAICLLMIVFPNNCFAVIDFHLIDANADRDIRRMTDGETIDLTQVGNALSIRVEVSDVIAVDTVRFEMDTGITHTEGIAPYSLAGDKKGDYYAWIPSTGQHILKAIAFDSNLNEIDTQTITFNVIKSTGDSSIIFTLVNAASDKDIYELDDNDTIVIDKVGSDLSIRADVLSNIEDVALIYFELDGTHFNTEGISPYTLAGDKKGDYYAWKYLPGEHVLKAIAYANDNTNITERVIRFTISDSDDDDEITPDPENNIDFTLVNAATNDDIFIIEDNSTINTSNVGRTLNIRVDTQEEIVVNSIRFEMDNEFIRAEGIAPYCLAGDKKGDYYAWRFTPGQHTLKAIAYGSKSTVVAEGSIRFTITDPDDDDGSDPTTIGRFNKNKDVLSLHFDHRDDPDDGHATVADRTVTLHYGIAPHVVSGTYGNQPAAYRVASERLMRTVWGNDGWLNAHRNWKQAVSKTADIWASAINNGGNVWVAEGGQSDFTAAVVKELRKKLSGTVTKKRIHVVQHSEWNEKYTRSSNLKYVKNNTHYVKIADGNKKGNGTAGLREEPDNSKGNRSIQKFMEKAQSSKYRKIWDAAFDYLNPRSEKLDFSDAVELLYILKIGTGTVADSEDFSEKFFSR